MSCVIQEQISILMIIQLFLKLPPRKKDGIFLWRFDWSSFIG